MDPAMYAILEQLNEFSTSQELGKDIRTSQNKPERDIHTDP
jgi:hypothetical protein